VPDEDDWELPLDPVAGGDGPTPQRPAEDVETAGRAAGHGVRAGGGLPAQPAAAAGRARRRARRRVPRARGGRTPSGQHVRAWRSARRRAATDRRPGRPVARSGEASATAWEPVVAGVRASEESRGHQRDADDERGSETSPASQALLASECAGSGAQSASRRLLVSRAGGRL